MGRARTIGHLGFLGSGALLGGSISSHSDLNEQALAMLGADQT
jgi:hypothetical protein